MIEYSTELVEDGRTLVDIRESRYEITKIAEGVRSYDSEKDQFTRGALENHIKDEMLRLVRYNEFFGLQEELGDSSSCHSTENGVVINFERYVLFNRKFGVPLEVSPALYVEPQTDGNLLLDFELKNIPGEPIEDLFRIYHMLRQEDFDFEIFEKEGRKRMRIIPATKGDVALMALKRVSEIYENLLFEKGPNFFRFERGKKKMGRSYGSRLLRTLGVDLE